MTATIDSKGIASGFTDGEDGWGTFMNQNLRLLSAMVMSGFANDIFTTTGLTYGYKSGIGITSSGLSPVAAGTVSLAASSTNYVVRTIAGVVSVTTSSTFADKILLATVTTNASVILTNTDGRYPQDISQDGTLSARFFATLGTTNPAASTGAVRLGNTEVIRARNFANTADIALIGSDATDKISIAGAGQATVVNGTLAVVGAASAPILKLGTSGGGELLALNGGTVTGAGDDGVAYAAFYDNAPTPGTRIGYVGFGAANTNLLDLANDKASGIVRLVNVGGSLQLRPTDVISTLPFSAPLFTGSGASLNSIPESAVVNLSTDLSSIFASLTALAGTDVAYNTRITAVEAARPFATVVNDNVPVARVNFGGALSYATNSGMGSITGAGNGGRASTIYYPLTTTGDDLQIAIYRLTDLVGNLVNDLKTRGVI